MSMITFSVIKADVGGWVGHSCIDPGLIEEAKDCLEAAQTQDLIVDCYFTACGDDLGLIMTHRQGVDSDATPDYARGRT